jgi:arylsulfatase A-like enzyme
MHSTDGSKHLGSDAYSRRRILRLLQGVGAAGLVGVAGCSGDDGDETPTETDGETPTETDGETPMDSPEATATPAGPASFSITSVDPSELSVPRGSPGSVSVTISNPGGESGTTEVTLEMAGAEIDSIDPGAETTVSLEFRTDTVESEYEFFVSTGDDRAAGTLTITAKPNIVVLFTEDWNWGTVWDDPAVETPALDQLAADGVSFNRAFCSSPSCSPARSAILSGQHFYRTGESSVLWGGYPDDLASYPELMAEAGYAVGRQGKGYGPGPNEDKAGPSVGSLSDLIEDSGDDPFCFWEGTFAAHRDFPDATDIDPAEVNVPPYLPDSDAVREDIADYYAHVQNIDHHVAELKSTLADADELENTIFIVTGDHGFAFPRGKANLYDSGTRVPFVVHWPAAIDDGREQTEFINYPDVGPTLLEAGGAEMPEEMTGESFLDLLVSGSSSSPREEVIVGYERHVPGQEEPYCGTGYPMRAIRTDDYLYAHNFKPDRWPNGTPNQQEACATGRWIASVDNGPTKLFMAANKDRDDMEANERGDSIADLYDLAFAKRPQDELYVLEDDPHQMDNVAAENPDIVEELRERLMDELEATDDPRVTQDDPPFNDYPYTGGGVTYPGDDALAQYEL